MNQTPTLKIQQYKSGIGAPFKHKRILAALGLGKMHRIVEKPDHPTIRGMVNKIPHLVRIVEQTAGK